jgi:hypothetical protein
VLGTQKLSVEAVVRSSSRLPELVDIPAEIETRGETPPFVSDFGSFPNKFAANAGPPGVPPGGMLQPPDLCECHGDRVPFATVLRLGTEADSESLTQCARAPPGPPAGAGLLGGGCKCATAGLGTARWRRSCVARCL